MADEVRTLIRADPAAPAASRGSILLPGLMRSFLDDDLVKIVRDHFMDDPRMGQLCARSPTGRKTGRRNPQDVAARHPDRKVRGQATYALGMWWRRSTEVMTLGRNRTESEKEHCLAEAKLVLRPGRRRLRRRCRGRWHVSARRQGEGRAALIANLPNLKVGKVAPEIVGEDLDGKPLKLSDHRGKVVVVCFWATWCARAWRWSPTSASWSSG